MNACPHRNATLLVTQISTLREVEEEDGVFLITPMDLDEPDVIQIELTCPECGEQRPLSTEQWEVI